MSLQKLHIAVLMGGWSSERPVSLMSGEGVAKALGVDEATVSRLKDGELQRIAKLLAAAGLKVVPIPGASSVTAVLSVAGAGGGDPSFVFAGFLPSKAGERRAAVQALAQSLKRLRVGLLHPQLDAGLAQREGTVGWHGGRPA